MNRWTIVARLEPQRRRACETYERQRVRVRCVCGIERDVFLQELQTGRTWGCDSRLCAARYLVSADLRAELERWSTREQEVFGGAAERALAQADALALRRLAEDLERERARSIDDVLGRFLRGPRTSEAPMSRSLFGSGPALAVAR